MMLDESDVDDPGRLLSRFVDNLPGIAYRCSPEPPWEMVFLRGRVEPLTGHQPAVFERGEVHFGSLVVDEDRADLERTVRAGIDEERQFTASYRIRTRNGDVRHVFERGVPVVEDGTVAALEGIIIDISQRKAYEQRLERQNDLFAHTQQLAGVGGWEYDLRTDTLRWTDQVKRIHGVPMDTSPSLEEAVGFYHPDDRPVIRDAVETALEDGESFDHELRIVTGHDEQRWVHVKGLPRVVDGEVVRLRGAVQDITDRHERGQSLQAEQALTRSIFEALPDLLYAFDESGSFQRWNDEFRQVTGYTDEEIAAMDPLDFVADTDDDRVHASIRKVFQQQEPTTVEARLETKDGDRIPYEFTGAPLLEADGTLEGLVGIGRDISGRKQRQRRFEAVFNNTYQFTGLLEPDGTVIEANDTALEFAGVDTGEVIGRKVWATGYFQHSAETRATVREAVERAAAGEFVRHELTAMGSDREVDIDFSIRPITDDEGEVILLVTEGRDITAFKNRERVLHLLHRLLRHNIRNDLTVIQGYADSLVDELSDEALAEYASSIDETAQDLLTTGETGKEMVNLILDDTSDTERLDLGAMVEQVAEGMQERYPETSISVAVEESVTVACDARVEAVFEQLIENGIEHNPKSEPRVEVCVFGHGDQACVEIADDGPGMSDEEWAMIRAEVGGSTSQLHHGSGMGLALARWTVDEFGGTLEYGDPDGERSVVTIRFPRA